MSLGNAMLIFRKDWREMSRNMQIVAPIVVVPLVISIVLPLIVILVPTMLAIPGSSFTNSDVLLQSLPADVQAQVAGMSTVQSLTYVFAVYFFAPFFLIIPVMASSVLSADSFAGEKDRKTLEALLATPLSDGDLLLGKILVSFIPAMLVTLLAFVVYTAVVDFGALGLFGRFILPNGLWLALILFVTPAVALAGIGVTVIVSLRVKGFREAQQLSALLVLPILAIIFAQVGGALFFGPTMLILMLVGFALLDVAVFYIGIRLFKREDILVKSV